MFFASILHFERISPFVLCTFEGTLPTWWLWRPGGWDALEMEAVGANMSVPCYSARFVHPFAEVLSKSERYPIEFIDQLRAVDPTTRISAAVANHVITQQVNQTGDPDLGLKAGRLMSVGGAGGLSYAMRSASTVRQAFEVAGRFAGLFSDLLDIRLEVDQGRATLLIDTGTPAVRPVPDFAMSALFTNHLRAPLGDSAHLEMLVRPSEAARDGRIRTDV